MNMRFANLYKDNREAVERALTAMWCGESGNESQQQYSKKLQEEIRRIFAPEDAKPVVQCMNSYEAVHSVAANVAKALVGGLWKTEKYNPYEHQYQSWRYLLEEKTEDDNPMSICVTTGTGSGKTECFMMPLVKDLIDKKKNGQIQALFLYPLNALMEDQKERLEELLEGTDLTYTVYNGDLPEREPADDDYSKAAELTRKRIELIRGWDSVKQDYKYKHLLYTRDKVRKTPPNILLTNPTMLEYILLRGTDARLTNAAQKSLSWVVIDETHTYTGAGAAELAMLLRRVLLAFGVKANSVRFATSSATFGNGADPEEEERQLQAFIGGITGISPKQVKVIGGKRIGEEVIPYDADGEKWRTLFQKEYVELDELFPGEGSIEDKLAQLDEMCQRVPKDADGNPLLKAKVHYFYRVPNNGLYVRLTEHENGSFKIYSLNNVKEDQKENPLLELCRCKHCGEYVALAQFNKAPGDKFGEYKAVEREDSDLFDLVDDEDTEKDEVLAIIGLSKDGNTRGDNNVSMSPEKGRLVSSLGHMDVNNPWHLVVNTKCKCPYCNSKLTKRKNSDEETDADAQESADSSYLMKFRTSPEFISRVMAPSVLDNLDKVASDDDDKIILHDGQQYISFADSRQLAAKATMKQNLEQERDWFYSTIFHELCKRKDSGQNVADEMTKLSLEMTQNVSNPTKMMEIAAKIQALQNRKPYLTWMEIADLLMKDKLCKVFCEQFVKRSGDSDEVDAQGNIPHDIKEKYVHSIMVMYLSSRPSSAAAPETLGLFCACYPQIEQIELPEAVEKFNAGISNEKYKISKEDWHHLIQIFMDYTVRSNQSLFLKLEDRNPLDIFACERFATEKPRRRPVKKPKMDPKSMTGARTVRYICELLKQDTGIGVAELYREKFALINNVVEALWSDVTNQAYNLVEPSMHWDKEGGGFVLDKVNEKDKAEGYTQALRFNLKNLCFKLYEDVYLCNTNTDASVRHTVCLRPIENNFKGFAPYLRGNEVLPLEEELHESWATYPYYKESGKKVTPEQVRTWAKENRKLLWNHHIWGENGVFENRLTNIYALPNLFIQAEHTAQVDKDVSRTLQQDFKEHTINILACSTTMEMGVDLGNLEVVMLTSVPPLPANYKQRAGRSGRNNKVQSACITLCGSDAIGLRTLFNPIASIISRPVCVPKVDLLSPQVVQRHVNSFLIRSFGVFKGGDNGGKLTQAVFDYYTNFEGRKNGRHLIIVDPETNDECTPNTKLETEGTMYDLFNKKCLEALDDNVRKELEELIHGTIFDGAVDTVVAKALDENKRCYMELGTKLKDIKLVYRDAQKDKFLTLLKMQYREVLLNRLLNYWATSRFTPNANMPVNVLTLDLNCAAVAKGYANMNSSNPSYGLREAIAQYAPGNSIVVDGVVYVVRGIEFANMYENSKTFKKIYHNSNKCVIDDNSIDGKLRWQANEQFGIELVQPVGFVPDMNEDKSRIMENNKYTHVSAQLIGTTDWDEKAKEPHLFSVRSNKDTGYAKILYYNEGQGYGYCMCAKCGRAVLETEAADPDDTLNNLPWEMNPKKPKKEGRPNYHFAINGKELLTHCCGSNDKTAIRRNVIIGDLLQTDFAEIRFRHKNQKKWLNNLSDEKNLIFTLGIVFTQALLDELGKERGAVDFAIMPNGHLCIFDTNPGGAGYSNQMTDGPLMKRIIRTAKEMLLEAKRKNSKDFLLNKFTLRYIDKIDIEAALEWIKEEEESRSDLPEEIAFVSKDASETSITNMQEAYSNNVRECIFFANDDFGRWDYDGTEHGWRTHLASSFSKAHVKTSLCVVRHHHDAYPEPTMQILRTVKAVWGKDVVEMLSPFGDKEVWPIAYIGDTLYFTNERETANLNDKWGNQTLFCARMSSIVKNASTVDCSYKDSTKFFFLQGNDSMQIKTTELGKVIQEHAGGIIDKFIAHCKNSDSKLTVSYQDEHLKSVMGMVMTLQTIGHFIKQIGRDFSLEFLMEVYDDPNYRGSITANLQNNMQRDQILRDLTEGWLNDLNNDYGISGELSPIKSQQYNTLTHWRVLNIECGGKRLSIFPDGGFANGWDLLRDWNVNTKRFHIDDTDTRDVIVLKRRNDIKFDVAMEDI